ncbi:MAG: serine protease [Desulfovibrio sp.]|jgi:S1-C subfamily serine protease|nr:serine protease [Desulfovibrio sp.]
MEPEKDAMKPRKRSLSGPALCALLLLACIGFAIFKLYDFNAGKAGHSREEADRQNALNAELRNEKLRLENLGDKNPCDVKLELSGQAPPVADAGQAASLPAETRKSEEATPTAQAQKGETADQSAGAKAGIETREKMVEVLEDATVFVLGHSDTVMSMGSGFFFAPELILTNRHVVEKTPRDLIVINRKLQRVVPARIVAVSQARQRDYAVLQVSLPQGMQITPLRFGLKARRTEHVSAWGYPHAISKSDPKYQALITGMAEAAPELSYADGVISTVLDRTPPIIVHTAPLSPGNSGGPLANEKGLVVGINSMISLDEDSYRQTSIALPASDILLFLKENSINVSPGE